MAGYLHGKLAFVDDHAMWFIICALRHILKSKLIFVSARQSHRKWWLGRNLRCGPSPVLVTRKPFLRYLVRYLNIHMSVCVCHASIPVSVTCTYIMYVYIYNMWIMYMYMIVCRQTREGTVNGESHLIDCEVFCLDNWHAYLCVKSFLTVLVIKHWLTYW